MSDSYRCAKCDYSTTSITPSGGRLPPLATICDDTELECPRCRHVTLLPRADALAVGVRKAASVWIVGRYVDDRYWELEGIFTTREAAVAACDERELFLSEIPLVVYPLAEVAK